MKKFYLTAFFCLIGIISLIALACSKPQEQTQTVPADAVPPVAEIKTPEPSPTPLFPALQAEITDDRFKATTAEIGKFDFRNFTYPLPRGWQHPETPDVTLENGKIKPIGTDIDDEMTAEEKAEKKAARRIGMSYVSTRFLDVNADGIDEAVVILKVETGGAAIPQLAYIYEWKDGKPELVWNFRTGDRADGGLKDIRVENGLLVVELYGQDRFLLGEVETGKITGDEEQLCCPTYFTQTSYKWNGKNFLMQGKRKTYLVAAPNEPPIENMGDAALKKDVKR